MRTLLTFLPAIACLAMMLLFCGPMMLRHNKEQSDAGEDSAQPSAESQELASLHEEVSLLKAKLALREESDVEPIQ